MRVLLVRDEQRIAGPLQHCLDAEGFVVELVPDGAAGLRAASTRSYDVIVLDVGLPAPTGYEVLGQLRSRGIWTPVLVLTPSAGGPVQRDTFDLGAEDYLTKPSSFVVLVGRLQALVRRGAPDRPVLLTVGSLVLDPARRVVTRRGVPVPLTAREYGLLLFLMRHAGDVVSKAQILEEVWDPAYGGGDNVVEVYISYLRRKLDVPFGLSTLHTVRGLGYRLDADIPDASA